MSDKLNLLKSSHFKIPDMPVEEVTLSKARQTFWKSCHYQKPGIPVEKLPVPVSLSKFCIPVQEQTLSDA